MHETRYPQALRGHLANRFDSPDAQRCRMIGNGDLGESTGRSSGRLTIPKVGDNTSVGKALVASPRQRPGSLLFSTSAR